MAAGFLTVYTAAMGLSTSLAAARYQEVFQNAGWSRATQARELLKTLEDTVGDAAGPDEDLAFRERLCRYLLGTLMTSSYGSKYQQFSGAVYDRDGNKVTEAESSISIDYGYPDGPLRSQPASWPILDYLTETEKEELAGYVDLDFRNLMKKLDQSEPPDAVEEYRFTVYFTSESREPYGVFVQKLLWGREGEAVLDPLTGAEHSSYTDTRYPGVNYHMTEGEIVWQWGSTEPPKGESFIYNSMSTGTMFPCLNNGYAAWKDWEENRYLHDFPQELLHLSEDDMQDLAASDTRDRRKMVVTSLVEGQGSDYCMILAYDSHPWLAAMDDMKAVYLICLLLMAICCGGILHVLERGYRKQAALEEDRRDFTNAMAHELKTPLSVIRGYAENLLERMNEEKRDHYLRQIIRQTEKMDALAAEMITISRLDSEQLVLQKEQISMEGLIREELEQLQAMADERKLHVRCEAEEDWILTGDRGYLAKALRNLLDNAVLYNRIDGELRIRIDPGICTIENTGTPLSEELLSQVFDMFCRGDRSRGGEHTGLGLYLAKRILTLQGLELEIGNVEDGVKASIRER